MIGLVVVSHSASLAEGIRQLVEQMTQGKVPLAVAGGVDDAENPIGTDPMKVRAAIESVYSEDGVIVLMDLGSAIMSAEMALEFLDADHRDNVHLCEAPLVEGALAAAVQASVNGTVEQILAEARGALAAKQNQLASAVSGNSPPPTAPAQAPTIGESLTVTVPNKLGIHARPAARIVGLTGQFDARLTIRKGASAADARSISQVSTLGARHGDELTFFADGADAAAALKAVQTLVDDNFGDVDSTDTTNGTAPKAQPRTAAPDGVIAGMAASNGIAVGQAHLLKAQTPQIERRAISDANAEQQRLKDAVTAAANDLRATINETRRKVGSSEANIFEAHWLTLQDPDLAAAAHKAISEQHHNAEAAWWDAIEGLAERYRHLEDAYLQARADDVLDVGRRVLRHLMPGQAQAITLAEPGILVAKSLSPSDTAQLDPKTITGIVTAEGGATGHSAIIARGLGIPAVVGAGSAINQIAAGATIAIDGGKGYVWPTPTQTELEQLSQQREAWLQQQRDLRESSRQAAVTKDGHHIEIAANIGNPRQAVGLPDAGAEGVGLFRTELLFMDRTQAPTEDEQYRAYVQAAHNLEGYPVIIRTLDVGGDKPISYIDIDPEENPFLGHRGIRYWLAAPSMARAQLRAICRASADGNIKVMFPMVATLDELQRAKALLADVQKALKTEGIAYGLNMQVGIMIEVPAAVMIAPQLAKHVDFFSVGTNDLTQYIMAADRGNPLVKELVSPFQPAVIHALKHITDAAKAAGIWAGMCGEMAGNPLATALLVGLGFDELSMNAPAIAEVKARIRGLDTAGARQLAEHTLTLESAEAVIDYLGSH